MSLLAAFNSTCNECAGDIEEGDLITSALDGYVHLDCGNDEDYEGRPLVLCPDCFLTKPCFCEENS